MDHPQETASNRIVAFPVQPSRPSPVGASASLPNSDRSGDAVNDHDRLIDVRPIGDRPVAGSECLTHIRSVSIGLSSGAFYPSVPTEATPFAARQRGVSTMEVMLQTPGEYQPAFVRQLGANARSAGVKIQSVHTVTHLHPLLNAYPRRAAEGRELFQRGIEAAVVLDAGILVWHGANRQDVARADGWERFIEITSELATACGEAGITLAIENVNTGALRLVRHVVNFATRLADIGTQHQIGFTFDPFQAAEAGANPFMMLAAMGNRVVNVHLSDYSQQHPERRHLVPGDGDLPWSALIRAIAGSGYSGPLVIEGPVGNDADGMERARTLLEPLLRSVFPFAPDGRRTDAPATELPAVPPAGVLRGIELFNARRFYEQHEEIEHEWHAERGPIRQVYQGLLQIGVGYYHALNGNHAGAVTLLRQGITRTAPFTPRVMGIETGELVAASQACLNRIEDLGPDQISEFTVRDIPIINLSSNVM